MVGLIHRNLALAAQLLRRQERNCLVVQAIHGFWLQHSAPKFPQAGAANYSGIQHPQQLFGQHFACFSLGTAALETVARTVQTSFPLVYSRHLPTQMISALPQARGQCTAFAKLFPCIAHPAETQQTRNLF